MSNVLYAFNVSQMRKPFTDPMWDEWKRLVPQVHDEAEAHAGFVARHHGEHYDLGYITPYPHTPLIMGNLSQWRSKDDLFDFTFSGTHKELMLRRTEWFEPWPPGLPVVAMWWAPPGKCCIRTARNKLRQLQMKGCSNAVFTWKS